MVGLLVLTGCTGGVGDPAETPTPPGPDIREPTIVPTALPTPTETPLPPRALFIAPPDADARLVAGLEETLAGLSAASGLALARLPELQAEDLSAETRMVVTLPPAADLPGLAGAHPEIGFIAIGIPGLEAGANLSVIGPQGFRPDQQGFAAGYLAAMLTEDWRVGVVSAGDTTDGQSARQGFLNGALFFCGLCRPAFPPFVLYPTFADVPANADEAAGQPAVDQLLGEAVETVYVSPAADSPGLRRLLRDAGFSLIAGTAGEAGEPSEVIAVIAPDPASSLEVLWTDMLSGAPGQALPMPISIRDVDPDLLSVGRLDLLESLIADLLSGVADTGIDPLTAEPR